MRIKKVFKLKERLLVAGLFLFVLLLVLHTKYSFAEISVISYCQLTVQSLQQQVSNNQELVALANQYKNNPQELARQEEIKRAEFDDATETLYASYGTTDEEYALFMGGNAQEVNKYLADNPDVNQQINNLSTQAKDLMGQYEYLKAKASLPKPPPPQP